MVYLNLEDMIGLIARALDCRRTCPSRGASAGCTARRVVLGGRDGIYGYAPEAKHSGRFDERGELLLDGSCGVFLGTGLTLYG